MAFLVAQMVNRLPAMRETQVRSSGREDPLEKETLLNNQPAVTQYYQGHYFQIPNIQ